MTLFVPLDADSPLPTTPSFLNAVANPTAELGKVVKAILKAKRITFVCGAGISVQAGIPDFRSSNGLFQSIKRDNPREALSSGKDLFDASVFNSEHTTALFCQMIARLATLSDKAGPTSFHKLLRRLDEKGKLLRVYTQNIDALEAKAGLTFGLPARDSGRRSKSAKSRGKEVAHPIEALGQLSISSDVATDTSVNSMCNPASSTTNTEVGPVAGPSRLTASQTMASPLVGTPRCIPLHGTLQTMHCQACTHTYPLFDHLPALFAGTPPDCPECTALETTRSLVGKRPRGVGKLRPSVVLYNEDHKDGEGVGEVARKDLIGGRSRGADLLIVVGTSLRVPGTKRIVREFSKAVKARAEAAREAAKERAEDREKATPNCSHVHLPTPSATPTSTPSPRRSPAIDDSPTPMTSIFLNLDFPVPTREWDGVFDVWLQGDAQKFAEAVEEEIEREEREKADLEERRRRREEERAEKAERLEREREGSERLAREAASMSTATKKGKEKQSRRQQVTPQLLNGDNGTQKRLKGKSRAKEKFAITKSKSSTPSEGVAVKRTTSFNASHGPNASTRRRRVNLVVNTPRSKSSHDQFKDDVGTHSKNGSSSGGSVPSTPIDSEASSSEHLAYDGIATAPTTGQQPHADSSSRVRRSQRQRPQGRTSHRPFLPNDPVSIDSAPDSSDYRDPLEALLPTQIPTSSARYEPYEPPSPPLDNDCYDNAERQDQDYYVGKWRLNVLTEGSVASRRKRRRSSGHLNTREMEDDGRIVGGSSARMRDDVNYASGYDFVDLRRQTSAPRRRNVYITHGRDYHRDTPPDLGVSYKWKEYQPRTSQRDAHLQRVHRENRAHVQYPSTHAPSATHEYGHQPFQRPPTPISPPLRPNFDDEIMDVDIMTADDDHSNAYPMSSDMLKGPGVATPACYRINTYRSSHHRERGPEIHMPVDQYTTRDDDYNYGSTPGAPKPERRWHERRRSASPVKINRPYQSSHAKTMEQEEMAQFPAHSRYFDSDIIHRSREDTGFDGYRGNKRGTPAIHLR